MVQYTNKYVQYLTRQLPYESREHLNCLLMNKRKKNNLENVLLSIPVSENNRVKTYTPVQKLQWRPDFISLHKSSE